MATCTRERMLFPFVLHTDLEACAMPPAVQPSQPPCSRQQQQQMLWITVQSLLSSDAAPEMTVTRSPGPRQMPRSQASHMVSTWQALVCFSRDTRDKEERLCPQVGLHASASTPPKAHRLPDWAPDVGVRGDWQVRLCDRPGVVHGFDVLGLISSHHQTLLHNPVLLCVVVERLQPLCARTRTQLSAHCGLSQGWRSVGSYNGQGATKPHPPQPPLVYRHNPPMQRHVRPTYLVGEQAYVIQEGLQLAGDHLPKLTLVDLCTAVDHPDGNPGCLGASFGPRSSHRPGISG
ncbi:hypothetical protein BDV95DRAFT_593129 [Massariosphaeria phaeospora]|uniref:Uncharacterized protein n=1 Tax=Massariosphaeria phaeospora TaxID=100035 RepID=A0A7C8MF43_9PLEO|nr:hypothetical protein BDV95DRAFT_593129 [Massariosphaeria phaeospora]